MICYPLASDLSIYVHDKYEAVACPSHDGKRVSELLTKNNEKKPKSMSQCLRYLLLENKNDTASNKLTSSVVP